MQAELAILTGWGRALRSASVTLAPDNIAELNSVFADPRPRAHGLIAHAGARSYGDCALNAQGHALLTSSLNGIRKFDAETGLIDVDPGVTFRQLMTDLLPRGFLVPVTPGTGFATIGGAVANDVHGKNHEKHGSFANHITELDLLTPDGQHRTIGPAREPELFAATCGGLGLTGLITRISFRMQKIPGPAMIVREERIADLDAYLAAMEAARNATYTVGWIDGTARGKHLGRGILEIAEHVPGNLPTPGGTLRVPLDFPMAALNPLSVRLFNELYARRVPNQPRSRIVHAQKFFYPLDALREWNRIYGKRGFHQFQNVVPFETGPAALRELLEVIAGTGRASFLAVLKRLGPPGAGYLSFPQPGYTLALDFPAGPGIEELYQKLVQITLKHGGRIYLAKDSLLRPDDFRAMYPKFPIFQKMLEQIDPKKLLQSDMSRRLRLRDAA